MNLQPVNPSYPSVGLVCCECGQYGKSEDMLADLDGPPFAAYYHKQCWTLKSISAASRTRIKEGDEDGNNEGGVTC